MTIQFLSDSFVFGEDIVRTYAALWRDYHFILHMCENFISITNKRDNVAITVQGFFEKKAGCLGNQYCLHVVDCRAPAFLFAMAPKANPKEMRKTCNKAAKAAAKSLNEDLRKMHKADHVKAVVQYLGQEDPLNLGSYIEGPQRY